MLIVVLVIVLPRNSSTIISNDSDNTAFVENHENALFAAQEETNANFAEIKNMYARKNTLIRELIVLSGTKNSTFLEDITQLQFSLNKELSPDKFMDYQIRMEEKITIILGQVAESKQESKKVELLIVQIEGAQNRISFAKRQYNESVKTYNLLVKGYGKDHLHFKRKNYLN